MIGRQPGPFMFAAYAVAIALIVVSARSAFLYYKVQNHSLVAFEREPHEKPQPPLATSTRGHSAIHYDYAAVAAVNQQLAALQVQLERTTAQLHEKNLLLEQRSAECRALEDKLDQWVAIAFDLAQDPEVESEAPSNEVKSPMDEEYLSLKKQLRDHQLLREEQSQVLDTLRRNVLEADLEVTTLRDRAEREIAALMNERLVLEAAASDTFMQLGEAAVPPLTAMLRHEHPEVRFWSATVLGKLGLNATAAIDPLSELANDPDMRVASAARRALSQIQP